jgi:glycosyltransferase involved in cell wall biosynthesis
VQRFAANSRHVADRIRRYYDREAVVIPPPVDCARFAPGTGGAGDYFLVVSAFAPYKRLEIALLAARRAGARLVVVGGGPEASRLVRLGRGARIEFLPWQSEDALARLYAGCRALLFPGEEDFGIVPVECMAAGRPVIARAAGGALETVVPGRTGVLVASDDPEAWAAVLGGFRAEEFDAAALRAHALGFDRPVHRARMIAWLASAWEAWERAREGRRR